MGQMEVFQATIGIIKNVSYAIVKIAIAQALMGVIHAQKPMPYSKSQIQMIKHAILAMTLIQSNVV